VQTDYALHVTIYPCSRSASMALPPLSRVLASSEEQDAPLAEALSILLEPTPILFSEIVPKVARSLSPDSHITSYSRLVSVSMGIIESCDDDLKAQFIAGHPRIGETHNLSNLSASEQGTDTPAEVLSRLKHLNNCYEKRYPGLRYITVVGGRSRAEIAQEMEVLLGIEHSLAPDEPGIDGIVPFDHSCHEWAVELDRAVFAVGGIAQNRLHSLPINS
jgi:hypothetical protein